jgi:hypothetical protein
MPHCVGFRDRQVLTALADSASCPPSMDYFFFKVKAIFRHLGLPQIDRGMGRFKAGVGGGKRGRYGEERSTLKKKNLKILQDFTAKPLVRSRRTSTTLAPHCVHQAPRIGWMRLPHTHRTSSVPGECVGAAVLVLLRRRIFKHDHEIQKGFQDG